VEVEETVVLDVVETVLVEEDVEVVLWVLVDDVVDVEV
jgi:hypothetical protein